jgi:hypothetical protein
MITLVGLLLLVPSASAAPSVELSLGAEAWTQDPFVNLAGLRLGAELRPLPWLGIAAEGTVYPDWGDSQLKTLTTQLIDTLALVPDISRPRQRVQGVLRLTPFASTSNRPDGTVWTRSLSLHGGLGTVHTRDDLDLLQATDSPEAQATANQWHPTTVLGLSGELRGPRWGARLRFERQAWTEEVWSLVDENKDPLWLGVELLRSWP